MNEDAGRGNWLFVTLRLESGEALSLLVDTGASVTTLDQSLEPKLGTRLGKARFWHYDEPLEAGIYAAPKLYLGSTLLKTGRIIGTLDSRDLSALSGHPVMGILGMDCLRHYWIQLDFTAGKMRFLEPGQVEAARVGQAFPLTFRRGAVPYIHHRGLFGAGRTDWLMDTGNGHDGDLEPRLFRREIRKRTLRAGGEAVNGKAPERAWAPECVWNGEPYTNLLLGNKANTIGLRFLARHLVTFAFPDRTMYLTRNRSTPLVDENMEEAAEFLQSLQRDGRLPGWSKNQAPTIELEAHPNSDTYDFRNSDDSFTRHYRVSRVSRDHPWKLEKAWRTDRKDRLIEDNSL